MKKRFKLHFGRKLEFIIGLSLTIFLVFSIFLMNTIISYNSEKNYTEEKIKIVNETINENISKTLINIDEVNKSIFLDEKFQNLVEKIYDEESYLDTIRSIDETFEKGISSSFHSFIKDIGYIPRNDIGELDISNFIHHGFNSLFDIQETMNENFIKIRETASLEIYKKGQLFVLEATSEQKSNNIIIFARNINDIRPSAFNNQLGIGFVTVNRLDLENILNYGLAIDGLHSYINNPQGLYFKSSGIDNINLDNEKYIIENNPLDFYGWTFTSVYDTSYIVKSMMNDIVTEIIAFILLIIIFIILYFLIHIRNLKSLFYMFDKFSSNVNKKLAKIEEVDDEEVNMVIKAYNDMVEFNNKLNDDVILEKDKALQNQIQKNEFEIKSLYSQINKHFLINVLSVVHSLVNLKEIDKANYCLENLSDFLRYSLNMESESDFKSELNSVVSYFKVQSIRYPKINYTLTYDERLDVIIVPKLIIQPLIENAYVHGLKTKKGTIDVSCKKIDSIININVANDANNIDKNKIDEINKKIQSLNIDTGEEKNSHGIALVNIQKRLKLMYGNNAKLSLSVVDDKIVSTINIVLEESGDTIC